MELRFSWNFHRFGLQIGFLPICRMYDTNLSSTAIETVSELQTFKMLRMKFEKQKTFSLKIQYHAFGRFKADLITGTSPRVL